MSSEKEMLSILIGEMTNIYEKWSTLVIDLSKERDSGEVLVLFQEFFFGAHNLKAGFEFVGLTDYSKYIHRVEDLFQAAKQGSIPVDAELKALVIEITLHLGSCIETLKDGKSTDPHIQVLTQKIDKLKAPASAPAAEATVDPVVAQILAESAGPKISDEESQRRRDREQMVSVKSIKLDDLLNLIGDLTIRFQVFRHKVMQDRLLKEKEQENLESILRDIGQLKEIAVDLRMQPVKSLLSRLQMVALDAAAKMEKDVTFQRDGDDVLLDKSVVDRLAESLSHIIRNAIDHGIEKPELRVQTHKPATSTLKVHVQENGPNVIIEISDDGRGIDPDFIFRKAVEKKLISADAVLSTVEKTELIFLPGFSTAEKVTVFSGRGIGMDIVKVTTKSLGGKIEVLSTVGSGTTFRISIPAQMSLVDALVVRVDSEKYGIAKQDLAQIIDLADYHIDHRTDSPSVMNFHDERVPLERLNERLMSRNRIRASIEEEIKTNGGSVGILIKSDKGHVAFCVDEVIQMQQVFVRPLQENMVDHDAFMGSTVFSNGEPGLMLNVLALVKSVERAG